MDAVEKQQGELDVLLKTGPQDNPQYLQIAQAVQQGTQEAQQLAAMGQQLPPDQMQLLQQAQQALQQIPPQISSVPVRPTDNHAVEALVTLGIINGPEGRRLASSREPNDQAIFQNLNLHYQQHDTQAKQMALQNAKPVPPKTSITVDPSKLPRRSKRLLFRSQGFQPMPQAFRAIRRCSRTKSPRRKRVLDLLGRSWKERQAL